MLKSYCKSEVGGSRIVVKRCLKINSNNLKIILSKYVKVILHIFLPKFSLPNNYYKFSLMILSYYLGKTTPFYR